MLEFAREQIQIAANHYKEKMHIIIKAQAQAIRNLEQ